MSKRDYYETLGVQRNADADTIKKAYRKLAMEHHPDRNAGDKKAEQKFKEINEAYDVLKDDQKRATYDRFGHQAFEGGGAARGGAGMGGFDFSSTFSDIFEDFFGGFGGAARGGQGGASGASRGADLRYNLSISLEEAFAGKQETIKVTTSVGCESCKGSGAEAGSKPTTCGTCNGAGRVRVQQGFFTIERGCNSCQGTGKIVKDPCRQCAGSGRTRKEKSLLVNIPSGVEEGTRIRLSGEGEAGTRGGQDGDLYIFLSIRPHTFFQRDGNNLLCKIPIPFTTAALGGSIEAPTIEGAKVKVTVPEGTQSGHTFRLRGKGMTPMRGNARGDMFIQVNVETPVNLNKKQRELLKEFEKSGGHTSPESEGFFGRLKEMFRD